MTTVEQLLGEFIDDWKAGRRPDAGAYLQRAPEGERGELARQISTWLELAPSPAFDDETRAQIEAEPVLVAARQRVAELRQPLAARLPTLREQAGLGLRDVARRICAAFGVGDEGRAEAYLRQLEGGELDAGRLSGRLLDALASILGADREHLVPGPAAAAAGGQAFFRAEEDAERWIEGDIDALSRAALAPAPDGPPMDELDRLFLGGPGA